jgi:hypothetical protein
MRDKRLEVGGRRQIKNRKMGGSEVGKLKVEDLPFSGGSKGRGVKIRISECGMVESLCSVFLYELK